MREIILKKRLKTCIAQSATLFSLQSFADVNIVCTNKNGDRNMIILGSVPDKGNLFCMSIYSQKLESYVMNCSPKNEGTKYSMTSTTRFGIQVNAEVDTKTGSAVIEGKKMKLTCTKIYSE